MYIQLTPSTLFDATRQKIVIDGKTTKLTTLESELLDVLSRKINELCIRVDILRRVWGQNNYFASRSMDVYICRLRKILKPDAKLEILCIHSKGYKLLVDTSHYDSETQRL